MIIAPFMHNHVLLNDINDYYDNNCIPITLISQKEIEDHNLIDFILVDYDFLNTNKNKIKHLESKTKNIIVIIPKDQEKGFHQYIAKIRPYHLIMDSEQEVNFLYQKLLPTYCKYKNNFWHHCIEGESTAEHNFSNSATLQEEFDKIWQKVELSTVFQDFHQILSLVANELISNAMYNAPTENGAAKYRSRDRKNKLLLTDKECPIMQVFDNQNSISLVIKDNFGSLTKEVLSNYLGREKEMVEHENKDGGAGVGLFLVMHYANRLIINIEPQKNTTIICSFNKTKRRKNFLQDSKSFYCFEWS
ncbi:MAG: hypothetical protein ACOCUT_02040 [bacterium]